MSVPAPLRVFLSYAHDSAEHRALVKALAQRLIAEGLEVTLDLDWPAPPDGWWLWVEREVTAADVVLQIITPAYRTAFDEMPRHWPGPVVELRLYEAESSHRPFIPVVFTDADAVHRPGPLAHQTFYSAETEQDIGLLLRLLRGFAGPAGATDATSSSEPTRLSSPLPVLEHYVSGVLARLSLHRRAWRYFCSRLEALGLTLEEQSISETGAQTLVGPGITLVLTQHREHCEASLDILPGTAPVYANLLGLVAGARQPVECTYLVFSLKPQYQIVSPLATLAERLAGTDIKLYGQQGFLLHGWRFVVPGIALAEPSGGPLKIVPRPAYPWPLNPLRLLLHMLEKCGALQNSPPP